MLIRNIWAVGRNYSEHIQELNSEIPVRPLVFLKAGSCASVNSTEIILPHWVDEVHHEVELALKFSAFYHIIEGAVALDLTERKQQTIAKDQGLPWTLAKSFTNACAVSSFFSVKHLDDLKNLELKLSVNDEVRQQGNTSQMIFPLEDLVEYIKLHFPVCPGDLILTGTPKGVGPIERGDVIRAEISGQLTHQWTVK